MAAEPTSPTARRRDRFALLAAAVALAAGIILLWTRPRPEPRTAALIAELRSAAARADAAAANGIEERLAAEGARALPPLRALLAERGGPPALRSRAAAILGAIGGPKSLAALSEALPTETDPEVRGQILLAAARFGGAESSVARALLREALASAAEAADNRSSAALLLAKRPDPESTRVLTETIASLDPPTAAEAVAALGFSPHPSIAAPVLRGLLRTDPGGPLRAVAVAALARAEGPLSLDVLQAELSDPSPEARRAAVESAGGMDAPAALALLEKALALDADPGVAKKISGAAAPGDTARDAGSAAGVDGPRAFG